MSGVRNTIEKKLNYLWYSKANIFSQCLLPLSWLFIFISVIRRFLLTRLAQETALPVIVVGNISVGGTGKTPLIIKLAKCLTSAGYRVGIISRGYGAVIARPTLITSSHTAYDVGDEPLEIFERTQLPVVVGANRFQSVLLLNQKTQCDLVLSDDGLQHYKLKRILEVIVVDGMRQFGNGYCLPAGPLRERIARLQEADFVVSQGVKLADMYFMQLRALAVINIKNPNKRMTLEQARELNWSVVTAIANPHKFLSTLQTAKIMHKKTRFFPDHHQFSQEDIDFGDSEGIMMTSKDAVKCRNLASENHWYLDYDIEVDKTLLDKLLSTVRRKLER